MSKVGKFGLKIKDHKEFECIRCGNPIKECGSGDEDGEWTESAILDGNVVRCVTGYGSVYDGDIFYFAICDECVDEQKDRCVYTGNYMDGEHREGDQEEFEKGKGYFLKPHSKKYREERK
jgi:hypothetical protein